MPGNNTVERAIRPIAFGRTPCSPARTAGARPRAIAASLVVRAKLDKGESLAWLTDVLERMISGRTKAYELGRLLPWNRKAERLTAAAGA